MLGGFMLINNLYLIVGSFDNEIQLFDIKNGILFKKFNKHTGNVVRFKSIKDKDNNEIYNDKY